MSESAANRSAAQEAGLENAVIRQYVASARRLAPPARLAEVVRFAFLVGTSKDGDGKPE
jgi:hypothetical protein